MAGRVVHVALLGVGGDGTAAAAYGDVRAITAGVLVGSELIETLGCCRPPRVLPAIDMAGGFGCLAREPRAGVERTIGAEGVGVAPMDLTGPHVDAVRRGEPV